MADRGRRKKKNNRRRIGPDLLDRDPKSLHPTRRHPTHQTVPFMGRSDRSLVFASPRRVPHIRRHRSIQLIHTSHRIAPCCTTLVTTSGRAGMCIPTHRHAPSIHPSPHPSCGPSAPRHRSLALQAVNDRANAVPRRNAREMPSGALAGVRPRAAQRTAARRVAGSPPRGDGISLLRVPLDCKSYQNTLTESLRRSIRRNRSMPRARIFPNGIVGSDAPASFGALRLGA